MSKYPVIIGRFEYIDIAGKLLNIPAKIDTGAYRSSIHADSINVITRGDRQYLRFTILNHPAFQKKRTIETAQFSEKTVTSSSGESTRRYEIKLKIKLGTKTFITSFTLADRSKNVFPILIGRKALSKRFFVDPSRASVSRLEIRRASTIVEIDDEDMEGVYQ